MTSERDAGDESLSGAYVLNALSEAERAAFEKRIAGSEELRGEVTELADTAVLLGLAAEPVQPSPRLKADIMAAIAELPQAPRDAREDAQKPASAATPPPPATGPAPAATAASRAQATADARWFRRPSIVLLTAAAAAALLFTGVLLGGLIAGPSPEQQQAAAFAELSAAPDAQRMGTQIDGGGTATLVVSESLGRSALVWSDLPELPDGRVYELWYITDEAVPAGLFHSNAATNYRVLDGELPDGAVVGVTIEPEGGSDTPTTEPIVVLETTGA